MRDFNYGSKQRKITASQIMLSKRLYTDFMTKIMLPSIYVLCLISSLDLIKQCQCSQSANIDATSEQPSSSEVHAQSRKLPDNVEVITSFGNLISDESLPSFIDDHKEFQYFDDSVDPVLITTPHYDTSPAFDIPSNHHAIHSLDITPPYLANVETVSYIPSEPYISGDPYAAKIPHTVHIQSVPKIPKIPKIPQKHFTPPRPPTFLKVTREPIWAPDVLNLEHQYIATFRSIRSSVMNFYNRMHNFFNYFMGFFSLGRLWIARIFVCKFLCIFRK